MDTVGPWRGHWKCWPCDAHGDIIEFVCFVKGISTGEAIAMLCPEERFPKRVFEPSMEMRRFLRNRKWEPGVAQELGLTVVADKYGRPRVRFPFRRGGKVVYWQDRATDTAQPKWLSSNGPTPCPYEVDRLSNVRDNWVILVEGLPDVVALAHDFPDCAAVGLAGASTLKSEWVPLFKGLRVCIIGDNDEAGLKMRQKTEQLLTPVTKEIAQVFLPSEFNDIDQWRQTDPAEFPVVFDALLSSGY